MSVHHTHTAAHRNVRRLAIVFAMTLVYLVAEVVGGVLTGSLALIADAGHMLADVGGLGLALFAIKLAERRATPERTYGYHRVEILAALTNSVLLIGTSIFILFESYRRFFDPPPVASGMMLVVASIGFLVNLVGLFLLRQGSEESLNLKGAYFEVLSDLIASVAVILAALIMWTTGWYYADPILSAGIGLFILPRTWRLMREAVNVLLEGTPAEINLASVREAIALLSGVEGVHDLHVWTLTSGIYAMSAHVVTGSEASHDRILSAVHDQVTSNFKISHVTVQLERKGWKDCEAHL